MPRHVGRSEVIDAVRELATGRAQGTVWVGIDGFGGAGKSSLADAVVAAVPEAVVVRVDDFWGPSIPEWDWPRFRVQVLAPLVAGRPARYQVWDWDTDTGGEWREIAPGRVVVVEGVSSTRAETGVSWQLTVWVDAPEEVRLRRALERDGPELLARWHADWIPSEKAYARRENPQQRVDLIVPGTD
jgi:uridine kinase